MISTDGNLKMAVVDFNKNLELELKASKFALPQWYKIIETLNEK